MATTIKEKMQEAFDAHFAVYGKDPEVMRHPQSFLGARPLYQAPELIEEAVVFTTRRSNQLAASGNAWNMICLGPQLHRWWGQAHFTLKWIGDVEDDGDNYSSFKVQWQWLPRKIHHKLEGELLSRDCLLSHSFSCTRIGGGPIPSSWSHKLPFLSKLWCPLLQIGIWIFTLFYADWASPASLI